MAPFDSGAVHPAVEPVLQAIDVPFAPGPVTVPAPVPFNETARSNVAGSNVAPTDFAEPIDTVHEPVPEHAPDQPLKIELESLGVAVSVTVAPFVAAALHPALEPEEHEIGPPATVPEPVPASVTVSGYVLGSNFAERLLLPFIVIRQVPVPEQVTPHPEKTELASGDAVSVTTVPLARFAVHPVAVQPLHATPLTVPAPVPRNATVSG
jgi:hypothetical protein